MQQQAGSQHTIAIPSHKHSFGWDLWEPAVKLVILILAIVIIGLAVKENLLFNLEYHMGRSMSLFYRYLLMSSSLIFVFSMAFRTYLWFKYRPYDAGRVEFWPYVTVAVPAYNEGNTLLDTVTSIVNCDYPKNKLRIITIDDGSTDDTYSFMEKAKEKYPDQVKLLKLSRNSGKRVALHAAFKKTTTPFFITVDSDTSLEPQALKEILTPLILNKKSGENSILISIKDTLHKISDYK